MPTIKRHVISVLLQNEVGALTRLTGMFSSRGYNIQTLNVAPTDDEIVSRVTLVVSGSDAAIGQLNAQLAKLVDVVNIHDMTLGEHFERELAIVKLKLKESADIARNFAKRHAAEILDDSEVSFTMLLHGRVNEIDAFVNEAPTIGKVSAVARSGSVAASRGEIVLSSFDTFQRLSG